ncbi:polyprenyl synthetase family protein [Virgibacillus sp. MSP4-1]|uniref:polyprenyl synthetase family protein n=1 Tax=Virgibacillus sp. MSP4-1 TaxID=2700081 RepID=UPI0003A9843D|nr:polyprenyl synthetase family protein [Virgibacillus sp. MSP4-1]QHS23544.1 polyprenyl synthetase family protein [Virgibacillus sp. MSP4-1]
MNEEIVVNTDSCYWLAEEKAADYFNRLYDQVHQKTYIPPLITDLKSWNHHRRHRHSLFSLFSSHRKKPESYNHYVKRLEQKGKLDDYLERSVSYIYLRDMGKDLSSPSTRIKVGNVVEHLKKQISQRKVSDLDAEQFNIAWLYRIAQKYQFESTMIWFIEKLKTISSVIPAEMDAEKAQLKLIKIITGVIINELEEKGKGMSPEELSRTLDTAVRLGYAYGLTYPFIDDLLDSKVLSEEEAKRYSEMIRTTLVTGSVPALGKWQGTNRHLVQFAHAELKKAFEYIKNHQTETTKNNFLEQAYVFFHAQEEDRNKDLSNGRYTNEEIFIPVILKSASSRLMIHVITSGENTEGLDQHTFYYGIYNQLSDDLRDMYSDLEEGTVTPYTYYLKHHKERPDLINPFELYWAVTHNLIHNIYHSDPKTCDVILGRAINGLKRLKAQFGTEKYHELMNQFASGIPKLNNLVQKISRKVDDVAFLDKLIRDQLIADLRNSSREQEEFFQSIEEIHPRINQMLTMPEEDAFPQDPIIDAANYSLSGDGKRLRPIVTWMMGVHGYGLKSSEMEPLIKSLEYMHTASLIFDDLPSQDNATIRRGKPTLHQVYRTSIAELTALFMTQRAVREETKLDGFDADTVLKVIHYSTKSTEEMCKGQVMDLNAKGKDLTLDEMNTISFYKTGLGFEVALVLPAMLAQAGESEISALKKFSRHFGITFQIKDDLLDVEGDQQQIGKNTGIDAENNHSNFVSILGAEGARKAMWDHYCEAMDALQEVPRNTAFLKQLLTYFVNRNH